MPVNARKELDRFVEMYSEGRDLVVRTARLVEYEFECRRRDGRSKLE